MNFYSFKPPSLWLLRKRVRRGHTSSAWPCSRGRGHRSEPSRWPRPHPPSGWSLPVSTPDRHAERRWSLKTSDQVPPLLLASLETDRVLAMAGKATLARPPLGWLNAQACFYLRAFARAASAWTPFPAGTHLGPALLTRC